MAPMDQLEHLSGCGHPSERGTVEGEVDVETKRLPSDPPGDTTTGQGSGGNVQAMS